MSHVDSAWAQINIEVGESGEEATCIQKRSEVKLRPRPGIIKSHKESKGTHSRIRNQLLEIRVEAWATSQRSKERRRVQADAPAPVLEAQRCPWKLVSSSENA